MLEQNTSFILSDDILEKNIEGACFRPPKIEKLSSLLFFLGSLLLSPLDPGLKGLLVSISSEDVSTSIFSCPSLNK